MTAQQIENAIECESCLEAGIHTEATTHSQNPDFSGYDLCEECAKHYDSREPIYAETEAAQ